MTTVTPIGRFRHGIQHHQLSAEYADLAKADEKAALLLHSHRFYAQATYAAIQAMEKLVKSEIFMFVSPCHQFFREETANHDLEKLLDALITIFPINNNTRNQIRTQLLQLLSGIDFGRLGNSLRYPKYSARFSTHSVLEVNDTDAHKMLRMLDVLKIFLKELHRLRT